MIIAIVYMRILAIEKVYMKVWKHNNTRRNHGTLSVCEEKIT